MNLSKPVCVLAAAAAGLATPAQAAPQILALLETFGTRCAELRP